MAPDADIRVLTVIDSLVAGGAERSLTSIAPSLIRAGVDLHVGYLIDRPGLQAELADAGVALHPIPGGGGRTGAFRRLAQLIDVVEPDLVHTSLFESDVVGRPAARLKGVPVVSSLVGEQYGPEHLDNPKYTRWKVRSAQVADMLTARLVRRFHAVSESVADVMSRNLLVDRSKIDVIPRGRDPEQLGRRSVERRQRVRHSLGLEEEHKLVLGIGRQFHVKGFDTVIDAFSSLAAVVPDSRLIIAGREGPATPELEKKLTESRLNGRVQLAGYREDVPDLLCAADVFVTASRTEGSPGAIIEALALEAPVVASDIPAVREMSGAEQAIRTVPVNRADEMTKAILDLIRHPEMARIQAERGRNRFEAGYTIDSVAKDTRAFYERSLR